MECPELPVGYPNLWREVALRGLYAYDGSYFGDPYRRIAVPARPLHITELPDDIASLLRADASLASESFAEISSLATPTD